MATNDDPSVWDNGPQYPDIWGQPTGAPTPDPTPEPSPVDSPPVQPAPVAATADVPVVAATQQMPATPGPATDDGGGGDQGDGSRSPLLLIGAVALGLVALGVVVWLLVGGGDSDQSVEVSGSVPTLPATPPPTVPPTVAVITSPPATTAPALIVPPTVDVPATQPATTVAATVAPTVPPSAPPTAPPTVPTTVAPTGPTVTIEGRTAPCRFGPDCLIAGFTIERFDTQPTEFVCEFGDGSRFTYNFDSDGVEYACATAASDGTITIEVAGVRSETIGRP